MNAAEESLEARGKRAVERVREHPRQVPAQRQRRKKRQQLLCIGVSVPSGELGLIAEARFRHQFLY